MAPLAGQPRSSSSSGTSHVYPDLSDQDQLPQHQTDHSRVTTETRNLHTDSSSKVAVCPVWLRSHAIYFAWWQKFILTAQKWHEVLVIRYRSGRRRAGFFSKQRNGSMVTLHQVWPYNFSVVTGYEYLKFDWPWRIHMLPKLPFVSIMIKMLNCSLNYLLFISSLIWQKEAFW